MNAKGEPRSWTDHLLWHHAAHTIDPFAYQAGRIVSANVLQGARHPELDRSTFSRWMGDFESGGEKGLFFWNFSAIKDRSVLAANTL